jgi:hypothetical protein
MRVNKQSRQDITGKYLTPWTMDLPLWISGLLIVPIVLFAVVAGYGGAFSTPALLSGCVIVAVGVWSRIRRLYREALARKAVGMLSSTHEGADIDVERVMRSALKNKEFVYGLCTAVRGSVWRVNPDDQRSAQWVITFPSEWSDMSWKWCAFGLICAGRPASMHCDKAQKNANNIVMELSAPGSLLGSINAWERTLRLSFNLAGYEALVLKEPFVMSTLSMKKKKITRIESPWLARVLLQPEGIELTLSFDGKVWYATTKKGDAIHTAAYEEWTEMWSVWRHFPEADTVLELNNAG